jgi:hypothetical protein
MGYNLVVDPGSLQGLGAIYNYPTEIYLCYILSVISVFYRNISRNIMKYNTVIQ